MMLEFRAEWQRYWSACKRKLFQGLNQHSKTGERLLYIQNMMRALWPDVKLDDSSEKYKKITQSIFSTVTGLSTDPPHMLDFQNITLTLPRPTLCHQVRRPSRDPTQHNSHTNRHIRHVLQKHSVSLGLFSCSHTQQLGWVILYLYWHRVRVQLSLMKQHGEKVYFHKGTRINVHFALWFIVYCVRSVCKIPLQCE